MPPVKTSGSPGKNPGVIELPDTLNPVVAKSSPPAPPNAASDTGMRGVPCPAIQYPYCRYTPGSPATSTCSDRSHACHTANPAATATIASSAAVGTPRASPDAPNPGHRAGRRRIAK